MEGAEKLIWLVVINAGMTALGVYAGLWLWNQAQYDGDGC